MKRWQLTVPVVLVAMLPATALAQGEKKVAAPAKAEGGVRKDPQGIKGISPFWEALKKGDDLFVARDFDGALGAYKDAITKDPQNPMGHYRIGETYLAKNDTQEAESSWVAALRFVGKDHVLKAKIMFVLADLRERQKSYDDATERWSAYGQFGQAQPAAKTYPATPPERKKRIEDWKKMVADYAVVKKRIEDRLKEADKKREEDASKRTKEK